MMKFANLLSLLLPLALLTSCATVSPTQSPAYDATKWYRDSAERTAADHEIFYFATKTIQHKVATEKLKPHQWGVILDVDDTILDNSDYEHELVLQDKYFNPKTYAQFVNQASAIATPGSKAFLHTIHRLGGYVNLVTNRASTFRQVTEIDLHKQGLYYDQLLMDKTKKSSVFVGKNPRFIAIEQGHAPSQLPPQKIVAWLGDNIQDFPVIQQSVIDKRNPNGRAYELFGITYFVLPNPIYGSWQKNTFH